MIEVANLTKVFGNTTAIDNLSFIVRKGEIVGFLGPNGAGKTTTMRILAGFLSPTGGTVTIAGLDALADSLQVRRKLGYLPENVPMYPEMRVNEYLHYRGRLKGLKGRELRNHVDEMMSSCGLEEVHTRIIGKLAKGYRQRVGLADSLLREPDLLILDEPTLGLDPSQRRHVRHLIKNLATRHTVLLSSHILTEVEMTCQRVMIINKGRIVASDTPDKLVGLMKGNTRVVAEIRGPRESIIEKLKCIPGVIDVSCTTSADWHRFTCECRKGADVRHGCYAAAAECKWDLRELTTEKKNLEDVYIAMTTQPDHTRKSAGDKLREKGPYQPERSIS